MRVRVPANARHWAAFEHRTAPLLDRIAFMRRMLRFAGVAGILVAGSLLLGILGYHFICGLAWIDSLLNASMILTGMGPVNEIVSTAGKLFSSAYALFSGVAFLTIVAVLLSPLAHRILHRLHLEMQDEGAGKER
ncbi:MAG TPA: hypothetical protein VFB49_11110 [Patescibacteria group bacterium]|nr:hypothetical protein [Patescibacteria group bacterium]